MLVHHLQPDQHIQLHLVGQITQHPVVMQMLQQVLHLQPVPIPQTVQQAHLML